MLNPRDISASYDDFLKHIPDQDCRYVVYNFEYNQIDGFRSKIVLLLWAPESAARIPKILYDGYKSTLKRHLEGLQIEMQGTDKSEIDQSEVLAKCQSTKPAIDSNVHIKPVDRKGFLNEI